MSTGIDTVISYLKRNWSIFPVFGDQRPEFAKYPAVRWSEYQRRPPFVEEINRWYIAQKLTGVAVVTGEVSRLVVLDFDSIDLYNTFCSEYPTLAHSYTVNTRRGKHIYYGLIPTLKVPPTMHGTGIDLQAEGAYVVAPPTTVDGFTYNVARDLPLHTLLPFEIAIIQNFIQSPKRKVTIPSKRPSQPTAPNHHITINHIQQLYRDTLNIGRNNALFWVSCLARDYGFTQAEVDNAMIILHANQPTPPNHPPETYASRTREARNTIASAYSRLPRPIKPYQPITPQLPNALREMLLEEKMMGVLRTIEGLRLVGITPGTQFTAADALDRLRGIIGRDTIRNALNAVAPQTGMSVFNPPRTPPGPDGIANDRCPEATNLCKLVTVKKSGKNGKGRPSVLYTMPSNDDLFTIFNQKPRKQTDPLTLDELKNVRSVRMALHRGFLIRLPGRWSIASFARRLNVNRRTIYIYHQLDRQFRRVPLFNTQIVKWKNLDVIFENEFPHNGFFLTDSVNKKYPAMEGIAKKLLGEKQDVLIHERIPNFWWYGSPDVPPIIVKYRADFARILEEQQRKKFAHVRLLTPESLELTTDSHNTAETIKIDISSPILNVSFTPPKHRVACDVETHRSIRYTDAIIQSPLLPDMPKIVPEGAQPVEPPPPTKTSKFARFHNFRCRFKDEAKEELALRLQKAINDRTTEKSHRITRESARRLVAKYSEAAINDALHLLEKRKNVVKPVGFVSTVLRASLRKM